MAELNLYQLRSVNSLKKITNTQICDNTKLGNNSKSGDETIDGNSFRDSTEEVIRLGKENETHRKRIEELTLYIQQATEG